jgi:FSR family fosmidomycin resistance protein-like MFS transporter
MCFTLCGLILLALAGSFGMVLLAAALVGTGGDDHRRQQRTKRTAEVAADLEQRLGQAVTAAGGPSAV